MNRKNTRYLHFFFAFWIGWGIILTCPIDLWADAHYSSATPPIASADAQFEYARYRFESNEYETAIAEFKRFLYFYGEDSRAAKARYHIGMGYFRLAKYDMALDYFKKTVKAQEGSKLAIEARFRISECHLRMNDPKAAESTLLNLIEENEKRSIRDRAFYQLGWLCLETGKIGQADTWFDRMSQSAQRTYLVADLKNDMARMASLPHKSPVLAGVFSIIPGGGYLYCNRYQDATVAFLVNGALMGAAYESFDNDLEVLGGLISAVGLGFYAGSIYGGISSAHKFNQSTYNDFIDDLAQDRPSWDFSVVPQKTGILLSFTFRF